MAETRRFPRKRFFVDRQVQGTLLVRAVMYWALSVLMVTVLLLCWRITTGPARILYTHFDELWFRYSPVLICGIVIMPIMLFDLVRLTHRFAGPMVRLRRGMRQLAAGERVAPIHFREGDFWLDFAAEFNAVAARMERLEKAAAATEGELLESAAATE
jgi:hypothetical protein